MCVCVCVRESSVPGLRLEVESSVAPPVLFDLERVVPYRCFPTLSTSTESGMSWRMDQCVCVRVCVYVCVCLFIRACVPERARAR